MQETHTTPQTEENPNMSGEGSHTLNFPPLSGELELKDVIYNSGTEMNIIRHLLNELKGLYEQRLRGLELDSSATREELLQKVDFLRSYVNDFADQNQVLVQTIEELQKETDHKFSSWGMKQCTSDQNLNVSEVDLKTLLLYDLGRPVAHISQNSSSRVQDAEELEDLKIQLQNKAMVISDLEMKLRDHLEQKQKVPESSEQLVHLQSEVSCLRQIHKDNMKEIAEKDICITKLRAKIQLLQQEAADTHDQLSEMNVKVRELQQKLGRKEEEWGQKEEKLKVKYEKEHQKAEERRRQEQQKRAEEWGKSVDRAKEEWKRKVNEERKTHVQAVKTWAEKAAILNSEIKEREEHLRQLDQDVVGLRASQDSLKKTLAARERHTQQLVEDNTQLKESLATLQSKLQTSECMLSHLSETLDQTTCSLKTERQQKQQIQDQLHSGNKEVERLQQELTRVHHTTEKRIQKREIKMCALVKELTESKKQLFDCQKELLRREKDLEKLCEERDELKVKMDSQSRECVHLNQTRERLEEDLALSHEKLHTSHLEVRSRDQLILQLRAEMKAAVQKHQGTQEQVAALESEVRHLNHKVRGHQEEARQLSKKIRDIEHLKDQKEKEQQELHDQLHTSQQQKLMLDRDLQLYQHSHSHSDDEYLRLAVHSQQLQKRCTEQVERLAECEKAILQMKSELERQTKETAGLKQTLSASHHVYLSNRSQLEQEVSHLKKEVGRLELELADTQKVHMDLLRQSEEELKEARQEVLRRSSEVNVQREEVKRLQDMLQKEEKKLRSAIRDNQSLSTCIRQLSQELEELRGKHQVTVEELAARAEEARQMEGCLNEGKLAEEKIRSMAVSLEMEVAELRKNLQEAVDQKLLAEREKQDAQDQVDTLQLELEGARSDNANIRHESQLVMTNINRWIAEQKASSESLTAQMKAQNKVLLIVTEEKEHLQEANDTLKAEVKRLKEMADEKERAMERFKAQIRDQSIQLDKRTVENEGCVALNLSRIEDMQTRMRSNLEAIGMLNQQLNALSRENKQLRRQLEKEMSMRRQVERLLHPPSTSQHCSSIHLPTSLSAHLPPKSTPLPSFLHLPHALSLDPASGDTGFQTKLCGAGPERPGES
ncbi:myosin-2 heavy chain-like isoform X2 [Anabas testudineus]|uniref:myosin-2 heavy chain-like isoform X2 n=1 Tax=Anabas testudineus TaxID=64144 RepID=UPI000E461040|nr:myosin-2 heavy chain-like isoform X2 [Anabas testudineus]